MNSSSTILSTCTAGIPTGYIQDFNYGYNSSGSANNGNVVTWTAMGSQTSNKSYSYDQVNRLSSMTGTGGNCTGLSCSFDVWGNRTAQTPTRGTCNQSNLTYDVHNRITNPGYSYDAAGNLVADGTHTYAYDAENRLTTVDGGSTATYVYDAMGNRVQKTAGSSTANYLYDLDGNITTDLLPSGTDAADYIFAGGQLIAEYTSGTTYFIHTNHLGTPSVITNLSGASIDCNSTYPYGEQDNTICTTSNSIWDKFTGYRLDPETGLEYAHARYYNPSLGRFMSPDPLGGDPKNPQSLNRYAYVLNNPLTLVDPSGLMAKGGPYPYVPPPQPNTREFDYLDIIFGQLAQMFQNMTVSAYSCENGDCGWTSEFNPDFWASWVDLSDVVSGPNKGTGCGATQAVSFIHTHQTDAATVARQLGVPTQNILGLSGIESTWGTSNAATQANNFFGLHGGANAPFANGVWYTSGKVAMSAFPSYSASAQSFAAQYGSNVQGVTDPTAFAQALVKAGFNPGKAPLGNPNFVRDTAATINATAGRMQCP